MLDSLSISRKNVSLISHDVYVHFVGVTSLTQSRIEQSNQMYCPLISVFGGNVAAKMDDFAPSSMDNGPLWVDISVSTYPGWT